LWRAALREALLPPTPPPHSPAWIGGCRVVAPRHCVGLGRDPSPRAPKPPTCVGAQTGNSAQRGPVRQSSPCGVHRPQTSCA
jgi:hypothetical protein